MLTMAGCESFGPLVSAWMDDDLGADERRAMARHLLTCADCRERLRAYGGIRHLLRTLPRPEPPRSVARTVHARLAAPSAVLDDDLVIPGWGEPSA